jgi:hypothetical protein
MNINESNITINSAGFAASIGVSNETEGVVNFDLSWDSIIVNEVSRRCCDVKDKPLLINAEVDSVKELMELSDKLREQADNLDSILRAKKILLMDSSSSTYRPKKMTYQQYIRGEY